MGQCDIVPGLAIIVGVTAKGEVGWSGDTTMDWDGQRPDSNPREWQCLDCNHRAAPAEFLPGGHKLKP